jgi:hypothetical protein
MASPGEHWWCYDWLPSGKISMLACIDGEKQRDTETEEKREREKERKTYPGHVA